jgi:hypothetical protein
MRIDQEWHLGVDSPVQDFVEDSECHTPDWRDRLVVSVLRVFLAVALVPLVALLGALTCLVAATAGIFSLAQRSLSWTLNSPPSMRGRDVVSRWTEASQGDDHEADRGVSAPAASSSEGVSRLLGPR